MSSKIFWLLEMEGVDSGDIDARQVFDDPEALGNWVRVNANDARLIRIAVASESNLVELRIGEAFDA